MVLPLFFLATLFMNCRGLEEGEEPSGRNALRLIQDRLSSTESAENRANLSNQLAATVNDGEIRSFGARNTVQDFSIVVPWE
jgi:hypothetical protein